VLLWRCHRCVWRPRVGANQVLQGTTSARVSAACLGGVSVLLSEVIVGFLPLSFDRYTALDNHYFFERT